MNNRFSVNAVSILLVSLILVSSFLTFSSNVGIAETPESMTFTSGEKINFTSTIEMEFKSPISMTFQSNVTMKFTSNTTIHFKELDGNGNLTICEYIQIVWPGGYIPPYCSWWEVIDPNTGKALGEIHIDGHEPPDLVHIDNVWPGPIPVPPGGGIIWAKKKIDIIEPCQFFEVHWPSHWWPQPCTWWEIIDPETGKNTGYEFHVGWTNESCEFHVDEVYPGPYVPFFPQYEIWARRKIPDIKPCDYFVVEEPPGWWPEPCTWWEIINSSSGVPTGLEFHIDWTNESCEFHVDEVYPDPLIIEWWPPPVNITAEQKIVNITACDWFEIVDPIGFLPEYCSWWEILDPFGKPTGLEFHVDESANDVFHVDAVLPSSPITIPWTPPSYTLVARKKIDIIQICDWYKVDDPEFTPVNCTWWELLDPITEEPTGWEFHVDQYDPITGWFHVDDVVPGPVDPPPTHKMTAEKKIDDIQPCDWFKVIDPLGWVPEPCSWWEIVWPDVWAGVIFHVDANDDISMFHIDRVDGGGPPPPPPPPPPWNVTARPYELPWYMKPPYPDYAQSGMPDFDERQWHTYNWTKGGRWTHCGPTAVANSFWWLDSEFEPNTIPPPTMIDNYPLVQSYSAGLWDDHDPQNAPPFIEHLAYLMDTDGQRTANASKYGTDVFDMEAGITHYLSWSGVNPLGDVDGDGNVTIQDVNIVNASMGTSPGMPGWDMRADIDPVTITYPPFANNLIDINDLALVTANMNATGRFHENTVLAPSWDLIVQEVEKCEDVVLLIAPWTYDDPNWYRYSEAAHFVTVAGLNATTMELVLSDPIRDNAEAGGYGDVPIPHIHLPPEPPYTTHNNASLVSHDAYHVIFEPCPGGNLTIIDYNNTYSPGPYPIWSWQIEAAVITSPYAVHDVAVTNVTSQPIINIGDTADVNVTVANEGSSPENFDVTVYANTTLAIDTQSVALNAGDETTLTFEWNTTGWTKCNYTLSAVADTVPGETDTADNTFTNGLVLVRWPYDVNGDNYAGIDDIVAVAEHFAAEPGEPDWDPKYDINLDDYVGIDDIVAVAEHFAESDP